MSNDLIVQENLKPGTSRDIWDAARDTSKIEGFATDISVNHGTDVSFKINVNVPTGQTAPYHIEIYRLGYYGGDGATLVTTINGLTGIAQAAPVVDATTGLVDAGNWTTSATWSVPTAAVSGVYLAKIVRDDTGDTNQIPFIVRADETRLDGTKSDIVFQTSDTTWQAYNGWSGNNAQVGADFYGGGVSHPPVADPGLNQDRAYAVSYNRPFLTRDGGGPAAGAQDFLFGAEYAGIYWLEKNGYDVSYIAGVDTDRLGVSALLGHKAYLSVGHDEYWSGNQRANVEAARDAGVNLAFLSGNEVYWKTRYEASTANTDGTPTDYRTLVSYKETWANRNPGAGPGDYANIDPNSQWTGTWRDGRFVASVDGTGQHTAIGGGNPENALTGQLFTADGSGAFGAAINVPQPESQLRFWRDTTVAANGGVNGLTPGILGYEFDSSPNDAFRPAGLIKLSDTTVNWNAILIDQGNTTVPGTVTHNLSLYKAPSGALVFGAGTTFWTWGLSDQHDSSPYGANIESPTIQQATLNLLADMGIQPGIADLALASQGLVRASKSTDTVAATTTVVAASTVEARQTLTITGSATDDDNNPATADGHVAAVEVSTDGGTTWQVATGTTNWSFNWKAQGVGDHTITARALDDSLNILPTASLQTVTVNVTPAPPPTSFNIFGLGDAPTQFFNDNISYELGTKFQSSAVGTITQIAYYRNASDAGDTDIRSGHLWAADGTLLATVSIISAPGDTGWQVANLSTPVSILPNAVYVVSYHTNDYYADTNNYFTNSAHLGPDGYLTAPKSADVGGNGVFAEGAGALFPTQVFKDSSYWVDATFVPFSGANVAPQITSGATFSVAENQTAVTTVTATDADVPAQSLTYAIVLPGGETGVGVDGAKFKINAATGELSFKTAPNFEAPTDVGGDNIYSVTVSVSDSIAAPVLQTLSVTVTDVFEPPVTSASLFAPSDTPATIVTDVVDTTDYELGVKFQASQAGFIKSLEYYRGAVDANDTDTRTLNLWTSTGQKLGSVTVVSTSGQTGWQIGDLATPIAIDANTTYVASYGTTQNYAFTRDYFVTGHTGPDGLLFAPASQQPSGGSSGGIGNGLFADGSPGSFPTGSFNAANYWVDVVFTTVVASNANPTFTSANAFSAAENQTVVGVVAATDTDLPAQTLAYSIVLPNGSNGAGADGAKFQIDAATGALSFKVAPDFEAPSDAGANNVYDVTVAVSDGAGGTAQQAVAVTVTDVVEAPPAAGAFDGHLVTAQYIFGGTANSLFPGAGASQTATVNVAPGAVEFANLPSPDAVAVGNGPFGLAAVDVGSTTIRIEYPLDSTQFSGTLNFATVADKPFNGVLLSDADGQLPAILGASIIDQAGFSTALTASNLTVTADSIFLSVAGNGRLVDADPGTPGAQPSFVVLSVDFNDAPVIQSNGGGATAAVNVAENTTAVTTVSAADADAGQALAYSIVLPTGSNGAGADGAKFQIDAATGVLSFKAAPDFETPLDAGANNVYDVTVAVSDGAGGLDTQTLAVTVTDVVESTVPTYSLFAPADAPANVITDAVDTTDYELGVKFEANQAGFIKSLEYYRGAVDSLDTDVRTLNLWTAAGVKLGSVTVTSTPGQTGWQVAQLATPVAIDANTVYVASYGTTQNYAVTGGYFNNAHVGPGGVITGLASASSGGNGVFADGQPGSFPTGSFNATNYWVDVVFEPAVVNTATPVFTSASSFNAPENQTVVGIVAATDADVPAQTLTYSIVLPAGANGAGADGAKFQIDASTGALSFKAAPDFEAPTDAGANNIYDVTVQASDGAGGITQQAIAVTVTDVVEAPPSAVAFDGHLVKAQYVFGTTANELFPGAGATQLATVNVAPGAVEFANLPSPDPVAVGNGPFGLASVDVGSTTVRIEYPLDSSQFSGALNFAPAADHPFNGVLLSDADGQLPTIVGATIVDQAGFNTPLTVADLTITADSIFLSVAGNGRLVDADPATPGAQPSFVVLSVDFNDAPVIQSNGGGDTANASIAENTTLVTTITATDADASQTLTYSIVDVGAGGAEDSNLFEIRNGSELHFKAAPDFENLPAAGATPGYQVTVQVSDGAGGIDTQVINVDVTDANDPPTAINTANAIASIAENTATQTKIADVLVSDPDSTVAFTDNPVSVDDARFIVTNGELFLKAGQVVNFETEPSINLVLSTSGVSTNLTLGVTDVNEAPTAINTANAIASIAENTATQTKIADVLVSDPDTTIAFQDNPVSVDDARFVVTNGELFLKAGQVVNFETEPSISLVLSTGGFSTNLTLGVTDVNEAPTAINATNAIASIAENTAVQTKIADVLVSDPDTTLAFTDNPVSVDDTRFVVTNGELFLKAGQVVDFETSPTISLNLSTGGVATSLTLGVTDVNDPPTAINTANAIAAIAENTAVQTKIADVLVSDPDSTVAFRDNPVSVNDARFVVTNGELFLKAGQVVDFETSPTINLVLSTGGISTNLALGVTNVNEPPSISSNSGGDTANISVAENSTAVTTVTAIDPDAGTALTYTLAGGTDVSKFSLNPTSGVLTFGSAPDFEAKGDANGDNVYEVTVQVSDGLGGIDTQALQVSVLNVVGATINGTNLADTINAGTTVAGQPFPTGEEDTIFGNDGNDAISALGGNDTIDGGLGNDTLNGGIGADSMTGGAGNDSYVVDNIGDTVVEAAGAGTGTDTVSTSLASYSLGNNVEILTFIGSGNFSGTGNALANTIIGGSGNDSLDGGAGNDTLNGGAGNDTYRIDSLGDVVTEAVGGGTDTVMSTVSNNSPLAANVENLTFVGVGGFTGVGNDLANIIIGGAAANLLFGKGGNDSLVGGVGNDTLSGGLGADTTEGGAGNDSYLLDDAGDVVIEQAGAGTDTVSTSLASYSLGNNVEILTFIGSGNFSGTGNALANTIIGGSGNDSLDGGAGNDTLNGGAGNDTYRIDSLGDVVTEAVGGGTDTVMSTVSNNSPLAANVENLTFVGVGGFTGVGNDLANIIIGGAAANLLFGKGGNDSLVGGVGNDTLSGGLGADTTEGGAGNDSYLLDDAGDVVIEQAGAGTDTVSTSLASYSLGNNVEILTFIGSGNFSGTGNALANTIIGGSGNDSLDGGAGNDTLNGGAGNDTYRIDSLGDVVTEAVGGGTDTVMSTVSNNSPLAANVENLTFVGVGGFTGVGNDLANIIIGGAAANLLFGKGGNDSLVGGVGNDTLSGGLGADTTEGGAGNDSYLLDDAGDVVIEQAGAGTDTVSTSLASYSLGNNVEILTFIGSGNFSGTGNALANTIIGGSGNDSLDGGAGNDTLNGGAGNDTYRIDSLGDVVTEAVGGGTDTVMSTVSNNSPLAANVENLTFVGVGGFTGVGNDLANIIIGGAAANLLFGKGGNDSLVGGVGNDTLSGGLGADTTEGGAGNDSYLLDDAGDVVIEQAGAGTDTVSTSLASYSLGNNVEILTFIGSGNFSGTGNALANTIIGGGGNDTLTGAGGNDTITGGAGNDSFVFRSGFGNDKVLDLQLGDAVNHDLLDLQGLGFASVADVLANTDLGVNAVIHAGLDTITLQGITKADLVAHDYALVI